MFSTLILVTVVVVALIFEFINGFHDTANAIATSISTRALSPRQALILASVLNFVGALVSESVAKTISTGLVAGNLEQYVIISALIAAIIWDLITWYLAIPSSSSHALIGGLVGSAIVYAWSFDKILWSGVLDKVVIPLFTSPVVGFVVGFLFMNILFEVLRPLSQKTVNKWFSKLQIISAAFVAFSHGSNDAQKTMGIITLALVSAGMLDSSAGIPIWVKLICAVAIALGTAIGGWRIIKTVGMNMIKLQPIGGFVAQTSAAAVISVMTSFGAPVSTTHVITSSVMGVGAAKRFSAVRWALAKNIISAWVITIPATMLLGASITLLIKVVVS